MTMCSPQLAAAALDEEGIVLTHAEEAPYRVVIVTSARSRDKGEMTRIEHPTVVSQRFILPWTVCSRSTCRRTPQIRLGLHHCRVDCSHLRVQNALAEDASARVSEAHCLQPLSKRCF